MRTAHTLGEQKLASCQICQNSFALTRYDQKYCSVDCRYQAKQHYKVVAWNERPDRLERNAKRKELYQQNREKVLEQNRQSRQRNLEKTRQQDRERYQKHKAKRLAAAYEYRKRNPHIREKAYHNARQKRPWQACLANASHRAAKKKLPFDLTREWCEQNWTGHCALTGLPFLFGNRRSYPFAPSVDRIDSSLGYTQTNCRFILFAINSFRGTGTDADMYKIADALLHYRSKLTPEKIKAPETRRTLG